MNQPRLAWRKSTRSGSSDCVEVAFLTDGVAVRDSKDSDSPVLVFTPGEWEAFLGGVRDGEFDAPRPPTTRPLAASAGSQRA